MTNEKVAVITGGATGIGRECARAFNKAGYRVAVIYRTSAESAAELVRELNGTDGFKAIAVRADVTEPEQVEDAFKSVISAFGRVDVLVNNAGTALNKLLIDMTDSEIDRLIDVDLKGAVLCSREAVRLMLKIGSGSIVNIASVWGVEGAAGETVYSAAKAGLIGFTKALSKELGYSGIRVNAISPGAIDTVMNSGFSDDEIIELTRSIPLGRMGRAEEVAAAVLFLAESEYVTGANLAIDGGFKG